MISHNVLNRVLKKIGVHRKLTPALYGNVNIDSRKAGKNDIFLAFVGERVDAHAFIPELVENDVLCIGEKDLDLKANYIKVPSVQQFLITLAGVFRSHTKKSVRLIGLTGSSGKTSTREYLVSLLKTKGKSVQGTHGNLNNHIGLPLTLLNKPLVTDYQVIEMGMNHAGEIKELTETAKPDVAFITNIGYAHIGNFESRDDLASAKLELFNYSKGKIIATYDSEYIQKWCRQHKERNMVTYGKDAENVDLSWTYKNNDLVFTYRKCIYQHKMDDMPHFMIENIIAAITVALAEHIEPETIDRALSTVKFPNFRGEEVSIGKRLFVVDCYNANPDSMMKSITSFKEKYYKKGDGELVLILGDMLELGKFSKKFHQELVKFVKSLKVFNRVFLVGREFEKTKVDFSTDKMLRFFGDINDVAVELPQSGYFFLKGSRGLRLELILDKLEDSS